MFDVGNAASGGRGLERTICFTLAAQCNNPGRSTMPVMRYLALTRRPGALMSKDGGNWQEAPSVGGSAQLVQHGGKVNTNGRKYVWSKSAQPEENSGISSDKALDSLKS